jgi:hypothetical protein
VKQRWIKNRALKATAGAVVCVVLSSCAGDYLESAKKSDNTLSAEAQKAASIMGTRIRFHHSDFYSLLNPNSSSCAGDAKRFYYPYASSSGSPAPLDTSYSSQYATIKPAFIKNVSVDVTDANANVTRNLAYSCTYGETSTSFANNCATFDYGAIEGVPTSLGGSLLIFGGVKNINYSAYPSRDDATLTVGCGPNIASPAGTDDEAGVNYCRSDFYALGLDALPQSEATNPPSLLAPALTSASTSISTFVKLSGATSYTGPEGSAGAAAAYNQEAKKFLLFGGATSLLTNAPTDVGYDVVDSWIFDVQKQSWSKLSAQGTSTAPAIANAWDNTTTVTLNPSRAPGGRALFGYSAVTEISVDGMTATGAVAAASKDKTDRIVIAGGVTGVDFSGNVTATSDVNKFNPTFGPEFIDNEAVVADKITQWIDSSPFSLLNNVTTGGLFYLNSASAKRFNFGAAAGRQVTTGIGYFFAAGGFTSAAATVSGADTNHVLRYSARTTNETDIFRFQGLATFGIKNNFATGNTIGAAKSPVNWTTIGPGGGDTFDFGGSSLVEGTDQSQSEFAYFGGVNCRDYLVISGATCSGTATAVVWNTTPTYWQLGNAAMPANVDTNATITTTFKTAATDLPSQRAGMAAAKGYDPSGNAIVVA